MDDEQRSRLQVSIAEWARKTFDTDEVIIGEAAKDEEDIAPTEEDAERYLVDFAIRNIGHWSVAEVWLADDQVLSINDLGEGLPLNDAEWPWAGERAA